MLRRNRGIVNNGSMTKSRHSESSKRKAEELETKIDDLLYRGESQPACSRVAMAGEAARLKTLENLEILFQNQSLSIANQKLAEDLLAGKHPKSSVSSDKSSSNNIPRRTSQRKMGGGAVAFPLIYTDYRRWPLLTENNHHEILLPAHGYDKLHACDLSVAEEHGYKMIGIPGHAKFGMTLEQWAKEKGTRDVVHSYDKVPLFADLKQRCIDNMLRSTYVFTGEAFAAAGLDPKSKKCQEKAKAVREHPTPTTLKEHYSFALAATEIHKQRADQIHETTIHLPHIDKIPSNAALVALQGFSFNFVAVGGEDRDEPFYDEDPKWDWRLYQEWKEGRPADELRRVENGEQMFKEFIKARGNRFCRILIYKLKEGDVLMFAASRYPHFTIIPSQDKPRTIALMHEMIGKKTCF